MRLQFRFATLIVIAIAGMLLLPALASASRSNAKIVNGTEIDKGGYDARWPFIVALVRMDGGTQYDGQFCGGALIDDMHVLTAAHCVNDPGELTQTNRMSPGSIGVATNIHTLDDRSMGIISRVDQVFVHPRYIQASFTNDFAVLRLATPVLDAHTVPLLTAAQSQALGLGATKLDGAAVAGWGDTDPVAPGGCCFPSVLREVTVPVQTDADCTANAAKLRLKFVAAAEMCAGTLGVPSALGVDSCQGDSGGPLTITVDGVPHLAGVVSFGFSCALKGYGIYARVTGGSDWITSIPGVVTGDDRPAVNGPGGTSAPRAVKGVAVGYDKVKLTWSAPVDGTPPAGYSVWVRVGTHPKNAIDIKLKSTGAHTIVVPVPAVRRATKYTFLVKALAPDNSDGPNGVGLAGPRVDNKKPTPVRGLTATKRGATIIAKWGSAKDLQSGIDGYEVWVLKGKRWVLAKETTAGKRSATFKGAKAKTTFRVRPMDAAGNYGAWVTKSI